MKARLVRIGNSRGVRLPKPRIARAASPRAGWAEAARQLHQRGEDALPDPPTSTRFDEREWKW
jgi:antitoxin MazE